MTDQANRVQEAQDNHWGTFCGEWETCEKYGICREECPNGGVADGGESNG